MSSQHQSVNSNHPLDEIVLEVNGEQGEVVSKERRLRRLLDTMKVTGQVFVVGDLNQRIIHVTPQIGKKMPQNVIGAVKSLALREHLRYNYATYEPVSTENQEKGKDVQGYIAQISALQRTIEETSKRESVLIDVNQKLGEQLRGLSKEKVTLDSKLSQLTSVNSRGDLHALELIRTGRVKSLAESSRNYTEALKLAGLDTHGDINAEIIKRINSSSESFETTQEYQQLKREYDEASEVVNMFKRGNRFLGEEMVKKANDTISSFEKLVAEAKTEANKDREIVEKLKEKVKGTRALYLMLNDSDKTNYKISVILPIEDKKDSREFNELEIDLVSHLQDQWMSLRTEIAGEPDRVTRKGLVEYTFSIPKESKNPEELRNIEALFAKRIFESQTKYAFSALGVRVDLEHVQTTSYLEKIEQPVIPLRTIEVEEIRETREEQSVAQTKVKDQYDSEEWILSPDATDYLVEVDKKAGRQVIGKSGYRGRLLRAIASGKIRSEKVSERKTYLKREDLIKLAGGQDDS